MHNKLTRKFLVLLCSIALIFTSWPLAMVAADTDSGGSSSSSGTVIYNMQDDPSIANADDGTPFTYSTSDYLTNSGDGTRTIVDYNGGKSIYLTERAADYYGIDIKLSALNLIPDTEYTITVTGHVYEDVTVPSDSQIVLSNPNPFGPYGQYEWIVNKPLTNGDFTLEYKTTFTASTISEIADNSYFRIQTSSQAENVPFYVDNIIITEGQPPVIYNMQDDPGIAGADDGTPFTNSISNYLINSGDGTRTIVDYNGGKSIYLTERTADYFAIDIKLSALNLTTNIEYTFTVIGHVDEDVDVPGNSQVVLSNPNPFGPYGQYQYLESRPLTNGEFTLEFKEIFTASAIAEIADDSYFRIQTNSPAANVPFYIDNIRITTAPSAEEPVDPEWDLTLNSLYKAYEDYFLFGNIISPHQVDNDEFVAMYKHHYNVITAENHMKPEALSPAKGEYRFDDANKMVDWALANGIKVHGHALIWHSQTSPWLTRDEDNQPLTRAEAKENLEEFISTVAGEFKGRLISWDVVNEAFADGVDFNGNWKDSLRKNSPWYIAYANGADEEAGESGADYIYDAFVQTRLADPDATLYYNDYNEEIPSKRDAIAAMVEDLNEQWKNDPRNGEPDRLLVEGIGMQSHHFTDSMSLENIENAIKRFIETGAMVTVSELDIPYGTYNNFESRTTPLNEQEQIIQAIRYAQVFQIYKKYADSIERVTIWGIADPHSWRSRGYPLLFDGLYAAKEAYYAVIDPETYLEENELPPPPELPKANAVRGTPTIDAERDAVWSDAPEINVNKRPDGQSEDAASAVVRTLWDEEYLYVYAEIADSELDNSSPNPWEQDSIEVFMSETVHRSAEYRDGDGQYRVTYEGNESFRSDNMSEGFESAAKEVDGGYVIEMKIPFRVIEPEVGTIISFDVQINDAFSDGGRLLTTWSDPKANGYNTTENWGELTLAEAPPKPTWDLTLDSLYETYEDYFLFGNIISPHQVDNEEFVAMYKHHYNVVTAENHMKPEALSPAKGEYRFDDADKMVDWALANGIEVHGHALIWHSQTSPWLTRDEDNQPLTRAEAKENLIEFIDNVAGHFKGRLISWDVVNEAFADGVDFNGNWKDSLRKNSPWYIAYANGADEEAGESGADYIYDAFVQTRLADPDATLYYNDYNEEIPSKRDAIAAMVEGLNEQWKNDPRNEEPDRLLVEGIGMQSHHFTDSMSLENIENAIKRFIETGAKVTVSELDIPYGSYSNFERRTTPLNEQEEIIQAIRYAQVFQIYKKYADSIERVTIWGIADPHSWRSRGYPLLFDSMYAAKEAYYAVIDPETYLEENELPPPPPAPELPKANAAQGTPTIDAERDAVWDDAPEINVNKRPDGQSEDAASAVVRTLWDEEYLYVYAEIADSELDNSSPNPWEQDSIEVFMSETVHRSAEYRDGDGQYRVTYEGNESFRSDNMGEGFESAAKEVDGGYVIEMKIPFRVIEPEVGTIVSFDVQINDAAADRDRLLTTWSDPFANGYNTTENWGELTLTGPEPEPEPGPSPSPGYGYVPISPSEPTIDITDGIVTVTPAVQVSDGVAKSSVSASILNQALEQAEINAAGKKQITVEIPAQSDVTSYEVEFPLANLADADDTVISIKTEQGVVELPGNMLANMGIESTDKITIRIAQAAKDQLSDEIRAQIGDRPVISLEVLVGDSIVEWNNPDAPVTVSVPYKPTLEEMANPDAIVIWYIDGQGRVTVVKNGRYDAASGTVIFKTTHFSDFAVVYNYKTFGDLASVPWAKQAIEAMAARGIINGTSATSYTPTAAIQRADFVLLLVSLLDLEDTGVPVATFDDVSSSAYYADAVKIARQHGIVQGKGNNLFGPTEVITRQDMMVMVMRALQAAGHDLAASGSLSRFSDAALVSDYARDSVAALAGAGIVQGSGNKLNPQGTLTRAEAAVVLYRLWSRL